MERFQKKIAQLLHAERATLFLVDRKQGLLRSKVAQHDGDKPLEIQLPLGTGVAGRVALRGETMNVPDAYACPEFHDEVDRRTGYRTHTILCAPIYDRRRVIFAVIQLLNKTGNGPFQASDVARLRDFGASIAPVLESCCHFELHPS